MIKWLYCFDLEARTKISEIFSLVFWTKLIFHTDILKLTDLYHEKKMYLLQRKYFEITIYSNSEMSEQFLKQNPYFNLFLHPIHWSK